MQQLLDSKPTPAPKKPRQTRLASSSGPLAEPLKKIKKPKRLRKLKLESFDQDLLKLIRRGTQNFQDIVLMLGVNPQETLLRVNLLKEHGFVIENEAQGKLSLTVKAYNEFKPKTLELSTEKKSRQVKTTLEPAKTSVMEQIREQPQRTAAQASGKIDLMELLEKGAPRGQNVELLKKAPSSQQAQTAQPEKNVSAGKETCQLCKEEFKLSMVGSRPKYGHCFCGAAYHKDCYEGILSADGKCVRCGRKLEFELLKETRDEIHKIKSVFEE